MKDRAQVGAPREVEPDAPEDRESPEGRPEHERDADHLQRARHERHHAAQEGEPGRFRQEARHQDGLHVRFRQGDLYRVSR